MYDKIDTLLPPFIVSGIIGTTLSLTVYSIFNILKDSHPRIKPSLLILAAATLFIISFLLTMLYIIFDKEFLLKPLSLYFLVGGGVFILISIIQLVKLHFLNDIIEKIIESGQFPELVGKKPNDEG